MGLVPFEAQTPSATNPPITSLGHTAGVINDLIEQQQAFSQMIRQCAQRFSGNLALMHRSVAIDGGTSEIKRNQIGERILGLPLDPLIN